MNWLPLQRVEQINEIKEESSHRPVLIFKHSNTCAISRAALSRLERNWSDNEPEAILYFLDLQAHRDVSNQVAQAFHVTHESPQVIVVKKGKAIYERSHFEIEHRGVVGALTSSS